MEIKNKRFDFFLTLLLLALISTGLLILYAGSSVLASRWTGQADYYFWKQMRWLGIGLCFLLLLALMPLRHLKRFALPAMLGSILLLLLVFVPGLGHSVSSSRDAFQRWLRIGPIVFQPSEFAKLALVLYAGRLFAKEEQPLFLDYRKALFPLVLFFLQILLILLEPQYGTSLCMILVLAMLVFLSGYPVLRLAVVFASVIPLLLLLVVFWEYRFERVNVWLDPWAHRYSGGYQLVTSFRAFAAGGFWGTEIASGFAHKYLTYGHTDFVFALFAEDFGIAGVVVLLLLFSGVLWRGAYLVSQAEDRFSFLLGAGSLVMLFMQTVLNMSVVTGLIPTTGVSLPFVSYGGSALITSLGFAGLLLNATSPYSED